MLSSISMVDASSSINNIDDAIINLESAKENLQFSLTIDENISEISTNDLIEKINDATISLGASQSNLQSLLGLDEEEEINGEVEEGSSNSLVNDITLATASLNVARLSLQNQLGFEDQPPKSSQTPVNAAAMLTNYADETIYLVMIDANEQQVNPTAIPVISHGFSYIPTYAQSVQILNVNNEQLIETVAIEFDTLYDVTYENDTWNINIAIEPQEYVYENATDLPLNISITTDSEIYNQQINPGQFYRQTMNPSEIAIIEVHADIAAISKPYNSDVSYDLTINENNKLESTQNAEIENSITNDSDWTILVDLVSLDEQQESTVLESGAQFHSTLLGSRVIAAPLIPNFTSEASLVGSYTFVNNEGQLSLEAAI